MSIVASYRLFDADDNEVLDLKSAELPLTIDQFVYLTGEETISTDAMDKIEITNLDIVNKIEKRIVSVDRPNDYKSNIIRPVFYKTYDSKPVELYPTVTFNIGVDLDQYKTKVDSFSIQIEGCTFPEIGRVPGYVLFKIAGNQLPKESPNGTYYILGDQMELVTTGKYSYAD